jgi:hypothetical protein
MPAGIDGELHALDDAEARHLLEDQLGAEIGTR